MKRMLTLVIAVVCLLPLSLNAVSAQEAPKCCEEVTIQDCPNCRTLKFELVGIDFPFGHLSTKAKAKTQECQEARDQKQVQIEVRCEAGTGVPFSSNIPYVARLFKNVGISGCQQEECEIVTDGVAVAGQPLPENFKVAICEGLSCAASCEGQCPATCSAGQCSATCSDGECPATCCAGQCPATCGEGECPATACAGQWAATWPEDPAERAAALVRHATHVRHSKKQAAGHTAIMHEMMELRMENVRLETHLEAMEAHLGMMEEMSQLRAENAMLTAKVQLMHAHHAQATQAHAFQRIHVAPKTATPTTPAITIVRPGTPLPAAAASTAHGLLHPPHLPAMAQPTQPKLRPAATSSCQPPTCQAAEFQRLQDQIRDLKKALHEQHSHNARTETTDR
ncbi:MAG: hypothetical protein ACR2NP_18835 [Pirellulaceae bacterium]